MIARPSKFGNVKTLVDGITFSSKKEARRFSELKLLERVGEIANLECQPAFPLDVNGVPVCRYVGDFRYVETKTGKTIVEDVKSEITRKHPVYRLKVKLLKAVRGIDVVEV